MEEIIFEISQEFILISVAIWILVAALYKLPISEAVFPKELMAIVIGIIVTIAGYFTGLFTGNLIILISTAIVAVFVSQTAYDKVKAIFKK
ncbi:MAG: hypothetical protein WDA59_11495 [Methanofastidiosum sp.]